MEVVLGGENDSFVGFDSLDFVSPFTSYFDRSLDGFSSSVHHQRHLESSELHRTLSALVNQEQKVIGLTSVRYFEKGPRELVWKARDERVSFEA